MKALIIDQVSPIIKKYLCDNGFDVDEMFLPTKQELIDIIADYELLVMRVDPKIDRDVLDAGKKLRAITVSAAGLNHIDLDYAAQRGIEVTNASGGNSNAVAEMTLCKILEMARHAFLANEAVKYKHEWNKYQWLGFELKGKTIGIFGYGKIGSRVGELARAFGMQVIACDPAFTAEELLQKGAVKVSKEELLRTAKVITLHVPLNDSTVDLISNKEFSIMRNDAIVLNMSRGRIINEAAAYQALKEGQIAALSVDVMECELNGGAVKGLLHVDSPLFEMKNFTVSPHIAGGGTMESLDALGAVVIDNIAQIFK